MLKAAFLYNFAKFVEWPTDALPAESDPFMICVIGEPRMAEATNRFVKDKLIHDRIVRARTPDSMSDVQSCHLLFIDASAGPVAKKLKHSAMTLPILTVGESDRFLSQGGIINLFVEEGRMRFEISPQAAERVQLKISSKLLTLAKITDAP
ncbi:MAG: YfiR family protein [Nitrospira sp.]|nr:YfiR family protein [Nitrospira sp.]